MQMIDVIKRLQELDAQNPNIVKESPADKSAVVTEDSLEECGPMGSMSQPRTPASINMTADSGTELTGMLKDLMSLAGLKQVEPDDLGCEPEPSVMRAEPNLGVSDRDSDRDSMRKVLDTLNDEEVQEMSNEPTEEIMGSMADEALLNTAEHNHDQAGGVGAAKGRGVVTPRAYPTSESTVENLMKEYRDFMAENFEQNVVKNNETEILSKIAAGGDDGYDMIYNGLDGKLGSKVEKILSDMYNEISTDHRLHPDDDSEKIMDYMMDYISSDYGQQGMAEGFNNDEDSELRAEILDVLQTIYDGSVAGENMSDNIVDELGDHFDRVDQSNDKLLKQVYNYVRDKGAEAMDEAEAASEQGDEESLENLPMVIKDIVEKAINKLKPDGVTEADQPSDKEEMPRSETDVDLVVKVAKDLVSEVQDNDENLSVAIDTVVDNFADEVKDQLGRMLIHNLR